MAKVDYHPGDRIAALATPPGMSALAVIRASGEGTISAVAGLFSRRNALIEAESHSAVYGTISDPETGMIIDDAVIVVYRGTKSYTGEESVDIMPHGSIPGVRMILDALFRNGFRQAGPGEFTMRGFINGKMDLTRAEAVRELIESKTKDAHRIAAIRLTGRVERIIEEVRGSLIDLIGPVELALDYPEEETGEPIHESPFDGTAAAGLVERIGGLIDGFQVGRIYQNGYRVVIAGATNAGKSSLFNMLVREERAIVSEIHGTTRDYIESWISIRELPVRLFDTAGLRPGAEELESEGIRRTETLLDEADCVLYLVDSARGVTSEDRAKIEQIGSERCIPVLSKCDLKHTGIPEGFVAVSARQRIGLGDLEQAVFGHAGGIEKAGDAVYLESDHQRRYLSACREALGRAIDSDLGRHPLDVVAAELHDAIRAIGELTGEVTSAEILDSIFSKFCVGK